MSYYKTTGTMTFTDGTDGGEVAIPGVLADLTAGQATALGPLVSPSTVPGVSGSTNPVAGNAVEWDPNLNLSSNNLFDGFTSTAMSASAVTLTVMSAPIQVFTGSVAQTVNLPVTSIPAGAQFIIINQSTSASVTVNASGGGTVLIVGPAVSAFFTALTASPTTPAGWNTQHIGINVSSGKVLTVGNSLTLNGTDGTVMTFPGASDTVVGSAATQTVTNKTVAASGNKVAGGLAALTSEVSMSNTAVETTVLSATLQTGELVAGSTYRIKVHSTVLNLLASNTLTIKAYLGGVALSSAYFQSGAVTNLAVWYEFLITVRTAGVSGTVMSNSVALGNGSGSSALTTADTVNTTVASPVLQVTAQFSAASASNNVKIENALIERVM